MMSVWHLAWILPVASLLGFLGACLFRANGK